MSERYPSDAELLAIEQDETTGVEYIPTGKSPYYLEFRKLLYRLLLGTRRANDLRVFEDGDLSVGVRGGRCMINGNTVSYAGVNDHAVADNDTTWIWLDDNGDLQSDTEGLPEVQGAYIPLAKVVTLGGGISELEDLRGEVFLNTTGLVGLGLSATAEEINQALEGINGSVTASALNNITGGSSSIADNEHTHREMNSDANSDVSYTLENISTLSDAAVSVQFSLPGHQLDQPRIGLIADSEFIHQVHSGVRRPMVGVMHISDTRNGTLNANDHGRVLGIVPANGEIVDVILSIGTNIQSSVGGDQISATVKVNGVSVTSTDPAVDSDAGSGLRCTGQGDGTSGVVKSDGAEQVSRGDLLEVDLTRTVSGTVSQEATQVAVLVVMVPDGPE